VLEEEHLPTTWGGEIAVESSTPPPTTPQEAQLFSFARSSLVQRFWHDPLLLSAFLAVGLVAGFQLAIHLLQPSWIGMVNDWLFFVLVWPELLVLVLLSWWFTQTHQPGALTWWLISAGQCFLAIRRTLLLTSEPALLLPLPPVLRWVQLTMLLQVLCLFLAFLFVPTTAPSGQYWLIRLRVFLDSLLLMSAVTLLSWYFLLLPLSLQRGLSQADRITDLALVLAGLSLLFILILLLIREQRPSLDSLVLGLLLLGVLLLLIGNFWFAALDLHTRHATSEPPDAFWMLGYLMLPLAGLVQVRLAHGGNGPQRGEPGTAGIQWQDLLDCLRFMLPFVVTLLVSVILLLRAFLAPTLWGTLIPALIADVVLLGLMIVRQGILFLEQGRLRRERAGALARELAVASATRQMETFVGMASHELKTPLTVMTLHLQCARRRLQRLRSQIPISPFDVVQAVQRCEQDLLGSEAQLQRQGRLIGELLDISRIQVGRLDLHLEPGELQAIVRAAVQEQREAWPERSIQPCLPPGGTVPITADADRIGQVVTNYLTNALRYSADDRPVEVGVRVEGQQGVVWVRDQGPGLPGEECQRIWERFYRAPGIAIQSGSGVGLGIGLYLCKTIVEQHQGQVGVQSTPGCGSTFWCALPLAAEEAGCDPEGSGQKTEVNEAQ
jgi:signal transduction histidine kinase